MKDKKGQITIFIIVGVIIVALAVLLYLIFPKIKTSISTGAKTPSEFIQNCLAGEIENSIDNLSVQGGYLEPELYFLKDDEKIGYLCYTNEYYKTCTMQQPLLKEFIESEIKNDIKADADKCFDSLVENYKKDNYNVNLKKGSMGVEILPGKVVATFNNTLTLTKDSAENYDSFKVTVNKKLYELLSITNSILNWEAKYGDAETTIYMNYYHDLKVEKQKQTDGTTIYILTDRNTNDKFQFASRSVAWPPGYGTNAVITQ
jgi:hypothetical protein